MKKITFWKKSRLTLVDGKWEFKHILEKKKKKPKSRYFLGIFYNTF